MKKTKERGITLVALIVTIVILLILAGITIATLTGNNGLFAIAKQAREETQKAQATDKINLKITNMQIASWAEKQEMPTLQYLADGFCQDEEMQYVETATQKTGSFLLPQIDASNLESIFVKLKEYPYEFEINSKLQLASIDGVQIETEVADSNFAESEEYQHMMSAINQLTQTNQQMQQQITQLQNNQTETNEKLNLAQNQIDNMQTSFEGITKTTLFEGTAGTVDTSYAISDISSYKYIIVYADCTDSKGGRCLKTTRIISVEDIVTNSLYGIGELNSTGSYYEINFMFQNTTNFYIVMIRREGFTNPRIYKIEGIK